MSPEQQRFLDRFTEACEADGRVAAAFLGGSFAAGTADEGSDLDIYIVATDPGYDDLLTGSTEFMQRLGTPAYLKDFNQFGFDMVIFTFEDGVEGELAFGRAGNFDHIHGGPYTTLVDKAGLLVGKTFPFYTIREADQRKNLETLVEGFWDNLSHFNASIRRGRLWSAYGSLDEMRMKCLKLLRLRRDFSSEHTAYSKVELYVPHDELQALEASCCSLDRSAMLQAAHILIDVYRQVAPQLAEQHGIEYPARLEAVVKKGFEGLER